MGSCSVHRLGGLGRAFPRVHMRRTNRSSLDQGGVAFAAPTPRPTRMPRARWVSTATLPFVHIACKRGGNRWIRRFAVSPERPVHGYARGEMLAQISTGLVQLHSRYYGKGPTKAKTHMVNDTVVAILRDGFTTVERTLVETGQVESVYQMRRSFQQSMEDEFRRVIEEATGRKVIAYMSSIHVDPDLAVELFVLEPIEEPASDGAGPASAEDPAV